MSILILLRRHDPLKLTAILFLTGLCSAIVALAFLLPGPMCASLRTIHPWTPMGMSMLALGVYAALQFYVNRQFVDLAESAVEHSRSQSISLLASSELPVVTGVGIPELTSIVTADARLVTSIIPSLSVCLVYAALALVSVVLLAFHSLVSIGLVIVITVANYFIVRLGDTGRILQAAETPECALRAVFADVAGGMRELVTDREKADDIAAAGSHAAKAAAAIRRRAGHWFGINFIAVDCSFTFIVVVELLLAKGFLGQAALPVELLLLNAVAMGPIQRLLYGLFEFKGAELAARRLITLEAGLSLAPRVPSSTSPMTQFNEIRLENLAFRYPSADELGGFDFGPLDFTLRRGEIVLVRGANGSGKSTLIGLLLAILKAGQGGMSVDRVAVTNANVQGYRALFSVVPASPHLFARLYGHSTFDKALAQEWLTALNLPENVPIDAPKSITDSLSKGQKKRLALVRAVVEERPILVLDEYTADQDPDSRERFYSEVLPRLRRSGKTVVAVVHDTTGDEFADRVVNLDRGHIVSNSTKPSAQTEER